MANKKGKRLRAIEGQLEKTTVDSLEKAVSFLKDNSKTKFAETLEVVVKLGVDPAQSDQQVRNVVSLPHGTGKQVRVAVFAKGKKADEARQAGAEIVGDDDLAEQVKSGNIDFDYCIATPDMMAVVGQLGRVLGPKGLMPNPKLGSVTNDVKQAVQAAKGGQVEFRTEKAGIVHAGVGKLSFAADALVENVKAFMAAVVKAKPAGAKGAYVKGVTISSTMGPGIKLEVSKLLEA